MWNIPETEYENVEIVSNSSEVQDEISELQAVAIDM